MRFMVKATWCGHRRMLGLVCVAAFGTLGTFAWTFAQGGAGLEVTRSFIAGGGKGTAAGGELELFGVIGLADAGVLRGGSLVASGAYLLPVIVGDCTADGFVGPPDTSRLPACLTGPNNTSDSGCNCLDMDGDGDVDLQDVAQFQAVFMRP